ncbi:hypothetical protein [Lentzea sp. NPDC004782]
MKPLMAAVVVIAVAVLVLVTAGSEDSSGEPRTPETFQRVILKPPEPRLN